MQGNSLLADTRGKDESILSGVRDTYPIHHQAGEAPPTWGRSLFYEIPKEVGEGTKGPEVCEGLRASGVAAGGGRASGRAVGLCSVLVRPVLKHDLSVLIPPCPWPH